MADFKPIETRYNGYRFRSRLEARWAVFFDSLGIKWEYEKEGYELSCGWYLPDFWLPQVSMFAEIKAVPFSEMEVSKIGQLAYGDQNPVLALVGTPDLRYYPAIQPPEYEHGGWMARIDVLDIQDDHSYWISENRFYWEDCEHMDFGGDTDWPEIPDGSPAGDLLESCCLKRKYVAFNESGVIAARSARFEFGERG